MRKPRLSLLLYFLAFFYMIVSYVPDTALSVGYSKAKTLIRNLSKSKESWS